MPLADPQAGALRNLAADERNRAGVGASFRDKCDVTCCTCIGTTCRDGCDVECPVCEVDVNVLM